MTEGGPKARVGDAIVCPQGHKAGHFTKDVPAGRSIRRHMLSLAGPALLRLHAYGCSDCDEPVAFEVKMSRGGWKVRTPFGWLE